MIIKISNKVFRVLPIIMLLIGMGEGFQAKGPVKTGVRVAENRVGEVARVGAVKATAAVKAAEAKVEVARAAAVKATAAVKAAEARVVVAVAKAVEARLAEEGRVAEQLRQR